MIIEVKRSQNGINDLSNDNREELNKDNKK